MADCCSGGGCPMYDREFDERSARRKLAELRKHGPPDTTVSLIETLSAGGIEGATVLDIGAGVGAVHLALLERGAASATDVDASAAYVAAAREEAIRRGVGHRVRHITGEFVATAPDLAAADLVALDRVVCCYDDVTALVSAAAKLARRRLGLVYPVDRWWTRLGIQAENLWQAARREPFRAFVHPTTTVDRLIREQGLQPSEARSGFIWQLAVYERIVSADVSAGSR